PRGEVDNRKRPEANAGAVRAVAASLRCFERRRAVLDIGPDIDRRDGLADLLGDGAVTREGEGPAFVSRRSAHAYGSELAHLHDPIAEDDRSRQLSLNGGDTDFGDFCWRGHPAFPQNMFAQ